MAISSCGGAAVKNPPTFVEMYLQQEESSLLSMQRKVESPLRAEGDYDETIYSHSDFHIAVITNGVNYDLLYSVELNDSLLGSCVYTNQSLAYKADATIIVESDNSYTTEIILTIPGSSSHDSYRSERTITLSKILFSRDTVDGTFPADIPTNTDTVIDFEVLAVNYFDETLGYSVVMTDGYIDVDLRPDNVEYTMASSAGVTDIVIPATINEYPVRSIFLEELMWVEHLTIEGAMEDVFIIGHFASLLTLDISGLVHELEPTTPTFKELAITALLPELTTLTISDTSGYRLFMKYNDQSLNDYYLDYGDDGLDAPYSFSALTSIVFDNCMFADMYFGGDMYNGGFPLLETMTVTDSNIGTLWFGDGDTLFGELVSLDFSSSQFSSINLNGTRPETSPAAVLILATGSYGYIEIKGDLWGDLVLTDVTVGNLLVTNTFGIYSPMTKLELSHVTFNGMNPGLRLVGNYPDLATIDIEYVTNGEISIGSVGAVYDSLTSITLAHIDGSRFYLGDRSSDFPLLAQVTITDSEFENGIRFGYETSSFASLATILIQDVDAASIVMGFTGDVFAGLELIHLLNVTLSGAFAIQGVTANLLEAIVCQNVAMASLSVTIVCVGFDFYFDTVTISATMYIGDTCDTIYVSNDPATSWPYYARAVELGIPVMTGTYSPT